MAIEVTVPPLVRQRAEANATGAEWLASLPQLLRQVSDRWGLELGEPYEGGTAGLVIAADTGLMSGADKAGWLANYIETMWRDLGEPMTRPTIDTALAYCAERASAHDDETAVLCHGDAHGWNTLDDGDGAYKFVDPEGLGHLAVASHGAGGDRPRESQGLRRRGCGAVPRGGRALCFRLGAVSRAWQPQ